MVKIDIVSGFLGAGKTTLIKKFIESGFFKEKIVIIENEFGEIGIDGVMLRKYGIDIKELNSGCICCTLTGDFVKSIDEIIEKFSPERILIEPSGVAKLSEVLNACESVEFRKKAIVDLKITVVDVTKYDIYISNFEDFFENQIKFANTIILSRIQNVSIETIEKTVAKIRKINKKANIISVPWENLDINDIKSNNIMLALNIDVDNLTSEHNHNHNDFSFDVFSIETNLIFSEDKLKNILTAIETDDSIGNIIRGKGIVKTENNLWLEFNYVPEEISVDKAEVSNIGKVCIIGTNLNNSKIEKLFNNM